MTYSPLEPKSMHAAFDVEWNYAKDYTIYSKGGEGKKWIDFSSGIYCTNVGHNNSNVNYNMENVLLKHAWQFPTEIRTKLLEKLNTFFPPYLNRIALFCEGSMANEKAVWLAEAYTKNQGCVFNPLSFHGNTHLLRNLHPQMSGIPAAFIIEPYIGYSCEFHDKSWVQNKVRECNDLGIVVIFDEIQAGFGRTGKMFGFQWYGVKPDLVTFGKGVANGMPLSGVIGRRKIMEALDGKSYICNTHSGNPVCCAAGLATLEEIEKMDLSVIRNNGKAIQRRTKAIRDYFSCVVDCAGRGYIHAISFDTVENCMNVTKKCLSKGLMLVNNISKKTIKIAPPLIMPLEVVMQGIDIIEQSLKEVKNETT